MLGNTWAVTWHVHGTLSADIIIRYKVPIDCTLLRVDTCSGADAEGSLIVGRLLPTSDDNGYITSYTPGHNATFDTKDRGDFNGALMTDTAECPHLAKDEVLLLTYTHNDSNTDVDIALTFLEG